MHSGWTPKKDRAPRDDEQTRGRERDLCARCAHARYRHRTTDDTDGSCGACSCAMFVPTSAREPRDAARSPLTSKTCEDCGHASDDHTRTPLAKEASVAIRCKHCSCASLVPTRDGARLFLGLDGARDALMRAIGAGVESKHPLMTIRAKEIAGDARTKREQLARILDYSRQIKGGDVDDRAVVIGAFLVSLGMDVDVIMRTITPHTATCALRVTLDAGETAIVDLDRMEIGRPATLDDLDRALASDATRAFFETQHAKPWPFAGALQDCDERVRAPGALAEQVRAVGLPASDLAREQYVRDIRKHHDVSVDAPNHDAPNCPNCGARAVPAKVTANTWTCEQCSSGLFRPITEPRALSHEEKTHDDAIATHARLTRRWAPGDLCVALMDIIYGEQFITVRENTIGRVLRTSLAGTLSVRWERFDRDDVRAPGAVVGVGVVVETSPDVLDRVTVLVEGHDGVIDAERSRAVIDALDHAALDHEVREALERDAPAPPAGAYAPEELTARAGAYGPRLHVDAPAPNGIDLGSIEATRLLFALGALTHPPALGYLGTQRTIEELVNASIPPGAKAQREAASVHGQNRNANAMGRLVNLGLAEPHKRAGRRGRHAPTVYAITHFGRDALRAFANAEKILGRLDGSVFVAGEVPR